MLCAATGGFVTLFSTIRGIFDPEATEWRYNFRLLEGDNIREHAHILLENRFASQKLAFNCEKHLSSLFSSVLLFQLQEILLYKRGF